MRKVGVMSVMLAVTVALLAVGPAFAPAKELPKNLAIGGFAIGVQAYSFNHYTFFEAIDKAKEVGAKVIEAYPGQALSPDDKTTKFDHNASDAVLEKVKAKLKAAGITLVNYGVVPLGKDEAVDRKVFDFAKKMGIYAITTEPEEGSWDVVEKLVKEYDIKIAVHNHPKPSKYWDPKYLAECIKGRDPRIGACADTGHWMRSGVKPLEALKILDGRIISSHLKDLTVFGKSDETAHDVPFGKGVGEVKAILDELKRQKFAGNISIEYEYNWTTSVPEIKQCVDFVRDYGMGEKKAEKKEEKKAEKKAEKAEKKAEKTEKKAEKAEKKVEKKAEQK